MKNSLRLLTAGLALIASVAAFAQTTGNTTATPPAGHPHFGPPPGSVVNDDGTITLPDGTVLPAPTVNADGTITLPDGTVIDPTKDHPPGPPFTKNSDGSITLPDGTVVQPNADGTYTMPDGHVIDLSKAPPAGGPGGHRGPPPSGE
jgi:hypothetical protein